ncbi:hypothetical protein ACKKBG_A20915 [Auxenochlorella protothecoides x Auxenochlorella symbiontica]
MLRSRSEGAVSNISKLRTMAMSSLNVHAQHGAPPSTRPSGSRPLTASQRARSKAHLYRSSTPPYKQASVVAHSLLMAESYKRLLKKSLVPDGIDTPATAEWLWYAPFALLCHDTRGAEPLFVYGNAAALELFETDWEGLQGVPSTRSAAPDGEIQSERQAALARALEKGYVENYSGDRVGFRGARFRIEGATLFSVTSPTGTAFGQAAVLPSWSHGDPAQ